MPIKQFRIQACLANTLNPERFTELLVEEGSDVNLYSVNQQDRVTDAVCSLNES